MKTFKTISGREIKVTPESSDNTFVIETESGRYRTISFSDDEFNELIYNTGNDWQQFLRTDEYYKI